MKKSSILLAFALLAACSGRPEWADGRPVTEQWPENAPPQDLGNVESRTLALHNRERAAVGAPPLVWDAALAAAAASYAADMARTDRFEHSPGNSRAGQGENLWMGTRGAYSVDDMIGGWAGEKRLFRAGTFPDVSPSGVWSDVAHYTQMIWHGTTRLGCAVRSNSRSDYLVCRYSPPGNVVGQPVP